MIDVGRIAKQMTQAKPRFGLQCAAGPVEPCLCGCSATPSSGVWAPVVVRRPWIQPKPTKFDRKSGLSQRRLDYNAKVELGDDTDEFGWTAAHSEVPMAEMLQNEKTAPV